MSLSASKAMRSIRARHLPVTAGAMHTRFASAKAELLGEGEYCHKSYEIEASERGSERGDSERMKERAMEGGEQCGL